jgi:hypothetical protein
VLVFKFMFSACAHVRLHAGTAALQARCRCRMAMIECRRRISSCDEENEDEDEDEDDMPPPLVGEDAVPDCAAAVRRERVESVTRPCRHNMGEPRFYSYMLCMVLP